MKQNETISKQNENMSKVIKFAAIDQYIETNIPSPVETTVSGKEFVIWGDANQYPEYLYSLYQDVGTLHSVIDGTVDYICGDGVLIDGVENIDINQSGLKASDFVKLISVDLMIYNGFAINVIRNKFGDITGLYPIPLQRLRTNSSKDKFYYSTDWSRSYGRVKTIVLPKFDPDSKDESSVYYHSNSTIGVYPIPVWSGAIKSCEIERQINDYHLNSISNGFSSSYLINFNNGVPTDEQKAEIEKYVNEKVAGSKNAGRILLSFNDGKDRSCELLKLDTDDFGEKFKALSERSKDQIFTSFRAIQNLFGLSTATGFSNEEYEQAFKLYNRTSVKPRQNIISTAFKAMTGKEMSIIPFSL